MSIDATFGDAYWEADQPDDLQRILENVQIVSLVLSAIVCLVSLQARGAAYMLFYIEIAQIITESFIPLRMLTITVRLIAAVVLVSTHPVSSVLLATFACSVA